MPASERPRLKAEVFKVMSHPLRLGVIEFLKDGEECAPPREERIEKLSGLPERPQSREAS